MYVEDDATVDRAENLATEWAAANAFFLDLRNLPIATWSGYLDRHPEHRTHGMAKRLLAEVEVELDRRPDHALSPVDIAEKIANTLTFRDAPSSVMSGSTDRTPCAIWVDTKRRWMRQRSRKRSTDPSRPARLTWRKRSTRALEFCSRYAEALMLLREARESRQATADMVRYVRAYVTADDPARGFQPPSPHRLN